MCYEFRSSAGQKWLAIWTHPVFVKRLAASHTVRQRTSKHPAAALCTVCRNSKKQQANPEPLLVPVRSLFRSSFTTKRPPSWNLPAVSFPPLNRIWKKRSAYAVLSVGQVEVQVKRTRPSGPNIGVAVRVPTTTTVRGTDVDSPVTAPSWFVSPPTIVSSESATPSPGRSQRE